MAKKRVHELAKQYDMPSKEVLERLAAAGIEVKAAASAVDEDAADRALTGKPQAEASTNGAGELAADGEEPSTDGKAAEDKP
ncbi:MAG: translation initiation factor IF-2 N-terminal domain-containing protein, partial [Actinomycetota bacterium]|nr:translation initiation factor IF-2 N-terminal domain-containing protein [Actinomycetota bacterium]